MQLKDIRIGNIIKTIKGNGGGNLAYWQITPEDFAEMLVKDDIGKFNEIYEPVILTNEWHQAFGATKEPMAWSYDVSRFKDEKLCLAFSGDYLYIKEYSHSPKHQQEIICLWNKDLKKEFFVHEFQNLYKDLTGKEIEIKNYSETIKY